ncbi:MAG: hypothetical protein A2622_06115 [Bdellovibrionales bacterium RIFCSPHIGHO2_01_FULL_40_29]|nr:MAG: hypothetical protein A2622_06115 [Bdellovibrionales bacterium RIFCSPHIGHO2_01_FULL_40_29]OFZ35024.1 MAG: hypothetical protein A3D17_06465 [Bdellovibrionales bacterium RIFCSPHIGHO2_02_FULL_40_15]
MTIEYVLLLVMGGVVFMSALIKAPKVGLEKGGVRLAARVETQIATGSGFKPYTGSNHDGRVPWVEKE